MKAGKRSSVQKLSKKSGVQEFDVFDYWESRYARGGDSGLGSAGNLAQFKAEVINQYVQQHSIKSIIEFGCGDGRQLQLARYPKYIGFDLSPTAVATCRRRFAADLTKQFFALPDYAGQQADLSISLDVIFHLVDDLLFEQYMGLLFQSSKEHIIIYSSNTDRQLELPRPPHVRHRQFSRWIDSHTPGWALTHHIKNPFPYDADTGDGSFADFFIFRFQRSPFGSTCRPKS